MMSVIRVALVTASVRRFMDTVLYLYSELFPAAFSFDFVALTALG